MGRSPCCEKGTGLLKKGPWTPEEDQKLVDYIHKHGYGNWRTLPVHAGLHRCGKSCRLRWTNYLRPDIKRGKFSNEEEETIIHLHSILGNKWSVIATRLPGRTDNEIKNYWNTHIRKKLLRMGIDPVTHAPRLDLLDVSSILAASNQQMMMINLLAGGGVNHQDHHQQQQSLLNPQLLRLAASLFASRPTAHDQDQPQQLISNTTFEHQIHEEQSNNYNNLVQTIDPAFGFPHDQLILQDDPSSLLYGSYNVDHNVSSNLLWSTDQEQEVLFGNNNVMICSSSSSTTNLNGLSNSSTPTPESSPAPLYSSNTNYSMSYVVDATSVLHDQDEKENTFSSSNNLLDFDIPTSRILNNNNDFFYM